MRSVNFCHQQDSKSSLKEALVTGPLSASGLLVPQPAIRQTTQIWIVTSHHYGITTIVSQTSVKDKPVGTSLFLPSFVKS